MNQGNGIRILLANAGSERYSKSSPDPIAMVRSGLQFLPSTMGYHSRIRSGMDLRDLRHHETHRCDMKRCDPEPCSRCDRESNEEYEQ